MRIYRRQQMGIAEGGTARRVEGGIYGKRTAEFNFAYADMDGRTSRGAQAALIAARKGMLLVAAAGNDGNKAWHYLSTPADADSILSVGAVDMAGEVAAFSSYGPSADGRVKPEPKQTA